MSSNQSNFSSKYLIIGGGMAADSGARGIRSKDSTGRITIISNEGLPPYTRPALSKKLWTDKSFHEEQTNMGTEKINDLKIIFNTQAISIDTKNKTVLTDQQQKITYEKLLLATGSRPKTIPGPKSDSVIFLRTFDDYQKIKNLSNKNKHVIVVGDSYIGTEIAAALAQNNTKVSLVIDSDRLFAQKFSQDLIDEYERRFEDHNVQIIRDHRAAEYDLKNGKVQLQLTDGHVLEADGLVFGLGVDYNLELIKGTEIKHDEKSVKVDKYLKTSVDDVWAAGDIIDYPDAIIGPNQSAHVDQANYSGFTAGENMTGAQIAYRHTPYFYSRVFGISWNALGHISSDLDIYKEPELTAKQNIFYYFDKNELLVGILLWNGTVDLDHFRNLLAGKPKLADLRKVLQLDRQ
ncbi:NAD(P)/FAD-dependent oxidoreductase [Oenococcus alcoholitolerans]|uniref:NAD(P)/FAD-dependent oxidoreductase n=1 Tax=Oenococcus alcoholitolerans TaxID=931074 RepID=UPI003F725686